MPRRPTASGHRRKMVLFGGTQLKGAEEQSGSPHALPERGALLERMDTASGYGRRSSSVTSCVRDYIDVLTKDLSRMRQPSVAFPMVLRERKVPGGNERKGTCAGGCCRVFLSLVLASARDDEKARCCFIHERYLWPSH